MPLASHLDVAKKMNYKSIKIFDFGKKLLHLIKILTTASYEVNLGIMSLPFSVIKAPWLPIVSLQNKFILTCYIMSNKKYN